MKPDVKCEEQTVTLAIRVQPRASKNEIAGWKEGRLYVRLTAPPVEGGANKAAVEFLAERLGLKRHQVTLVSGEKSREKVVAVEGLNREEILTKLGKGTGA